MDEKFIIELADDGIYIGTENSSGAVYDPPDSDSILSVKEALISAFENYIEYQWGGVGDV